MNWGSAFSGRPSVLFNRSPQLAVRLNPMNDTIQGLGEAQVGDFPSPSPQ
jgi:hypothetical protein